MMGVPPLLSLSDAPFPPPARPELLAANAAEAEPQAYRVTGLSRRTLSIRAEPDAAAEVVGEIRQRALVFGCTNDTPSRTTWCRVSVRPHRRLGAAALPFAGLMRDAASGQLWYRHGKRVAPVKVPMRALQLFGDRDLRLTRGRAPAPPGPGEVRLRIRAVG